MCAEGITLFDGSRESRADDRATDSRIGGAPLERIGPDTVLVGVGCCEMSRQFGVMQLDQRQGVYVLLRKRTRPDPEAG